MTRIGTGLPATATSRSSGSLVQLRPGSTARPKNPRPAQASSRTRGVLAHPAGEHDGVDPAGRGGHGGDPSPEAVQVDREGEGGSLVTRVSRGDDPAHVARCPRQAGQAGFPVEGSLDVVHREVAVARTHSSKPGVDGARQMAMTSTSSGVNPIVVSTGAPPATAAREAPAPRWQTTRRSSAAGTPSSSETRRVA